MLRLSKLGVSVTCSWRSHRVTVSKRKTGIVRLVIMTRAYTSWLTLECEGSCGVYVCMYAYVWVCGSCGGDIHFSRKYVHMEAISFTRDTSPYIIIPTEMSKDCRMFRIAYRDLFRKEYTSKSIGINRITMILHRSTRYSSRPLCRMAFANSWNALDRRCPKFA